MNEVSFPGEELRARREELGLTVEDVYHKLHIAPAYIEAMERSDFGALPAPCYALGFVKTYCDCLGLDPEPFVDSVRVLGRPAGGRLLRLPRTRSRTARSWIGELVTWAAICAIILLGWLTYTAIVRPKAEVTNGRVEAGVEQTEVSDSDAPP